DGLAGATRRSTFHIADDEFVEQVKYRLLGLLKVMSAIRQENQPLRLQRVVKDILRAFGRQHGISGAVDQQQRTWRNVRDSIGSEVLTGQRRDRGDRGEQRTGLNR